METKWETKRNQTKRYERMYESERKNFLYPKATPKIQNGRANKKNG